MLLVFIFLQFLAIINLKQSFLICSFNLFFMVVQISKTTAIGLFQRFIVYFSMCSLLCNFVNHITNVIVLLLI